MPGLGKKTDTKYFAKDKKNFSLSLLKAGKREEEEKEPKKAEASMLRYDIFFVAFRVEENEGNALSDFNAKITKSLAAVNKKVALQTIEETNKKEIM